MKMKLKSVFLSLALLFTVVATTTSCSRVNVESDTLYVEKVKGMKNNFILGMDASSVISLEEAGVKYYNHDGIEEDVFKILADNGINYIRVRVWNDPFDENGNGYGGGNCDINTAVEIGKRATKYGMKLLVNFHYSDFWADPAKQMCPKAWVGMEITEKAMALYEYTKESLQLLKDNNVDVGMIQIGNETNGAMAGEKIWFNIASLMTQASKACREVYKKAKIAVHFANPEKVTNYKDYASKLNYYKIDYDVFASSYYPYWHGTLDNLSTLLNEISDTYDKDVMVAETSYAWTAEDSDFYGNTITDGGAIVKTHPFTIQGQANSIRSIVNCVVNDMDRGIGVFYWEGTWIPTGGSSWEENSAMWEKYGTGWASSYAAGYDPNDAGKYYGGNSVDNQAFFDANGKALESLKLWALLRKGNKIDITPDAIADTTIVCDLAGEIVLPTKVNAIMVDDSKQEIDVEWKYYQVTDENYVTTKYDTIDFNAFKTGGAKKYDIVGIAGGMEAHCYLSMIEFNFLNNYSFEDDANATPTPTGWTVNQIGSADELHCEIKATDSLTGQGHYHFWSSASNSVEFYLEQEVTRNDFIAGKYKFSISIMGGDCGITDIYAYAKINGTITKTSPLTINGYGNWDTTTIYDIEYNGTDTFVVGIYVKCAGENNGAWGKIDDALLNSQLD